MEDTSICCVCGEAKNQGTVCHLCRAAYISRAVGIPLDCTCLNCDKYGFPCLNCAEYCFHGMLGEGHPSSSEENELDSMEMYTV